MNDQFQGWYLDRDGEAPGLPLFIPVETERPFLEHLVAGRVDRMLIRGESLCDWAFEVATARAISCKDAPNPARLISALYSDVDKRSIQRILDVLAEQAWDESVLTSPRALLSRLDAEGSALWRCSASPDHAASWLLWWMSADEYVRPLAIALGETFAGTASSPFLHRCYAVKGAEEAMKLFAVWTGVIAGEDVPIWRDEYLSQGDARTAHVRGVLLKSVREVLAGDGLHAAERTLLRLRDSWLRSQFAEDVAVYARSHSELLTNHTVSWLEPYVSTAIIADLRNAVPVAVPDRLPTKAEEIATWFEESYRPWLTWSMANVWDGATHERIGSSFSERYLQLFQGMLDSDQGAERIAWQRSARLRKEISESEPQSSTLLIVLDGVGPTDIDHLLRACAETAPALSVTSTDWVYVAPPSATPFTKPTVVAGRPSVDAGDHAAEIRGMKATAQIVDALQSRPFVTWSLEEPDKAYHQSTLTQELSDVQHLVGSQLRTVAGLLGRIVADLGTEFQLRVAVTADHGRLLRNSDRTEPAPEGMTSHGRCAWGIPQTPVQMSSSYECQGDLLWLNPSAFFLPDGQAYAVRRDALAFSPANNARGLEVYPHGGLFPEEVVVPWVTMETKIEDVAPTLSASGAGVAGSEGSVTILASNQSRYVLQLEDIRLEDGTALQVAEGFPPALRPFENTEIHVTVPIWPQADSLRLEIVFRAPSGRRLVEDVTATLETRSMYKQNDPLADLEF